MQSKALMRVRRTPPKALGLILRAGRERRGLSQSEVARRVGIGQGYVWLLEQGERTPSMVVAELLADVLQLPLDDCRQLYAAAVTDAGRSHPGRAAQKPSRAGHA